MANATTDTIQPDAEPTSTTSGNHVVLFHSIEYYQHLGEIWFVDPSIGEESRQTLAGHDEFLWGDAIPARVADNNRRIAAALAALNVEVKLPEPDEMLRLTWQHCDLRDDADHRYTVVMTRAKLAEFMGLLGHWFLPATADLGCKNSDEFCKTFCQERYRLKAEHGLTVPDPTKLTCNCGGGGETCVQVEAVEPVVPAAG